MSVPADFEVNKVLDRRPMFGLRAMRTEVRVRCDGLERHEAHLSIEDLP